MLLGLHENLCMSDAISRCRCTITQLIAVILIVNAQIREDEEGEQV